MKTLYLNNSEFSAFCKVKRRKQNHKISFHFFSGSPHTPRRKWIGKEIFGFGSRPEGARGASIIRQNPADFPHTMFELRPKNTANFHFCPKRQERACPEATRNAIFALCATVFSEQWKARGRARGGSFEQSSKQNKSFATNLFIRPIGRMLCDF